MLEVRLPRRRWSGPVTQFSAPTRQQPPTPEARERFGVPCTVSRIALLGQSAVDRVHASFGPPGTVGRHPVPTRFFTSEPAALAWLLNETSED